MKNKQKAKDIISETLLSAEMIQQFAEEAIELLDNAEEDLLALEQMPDSKSLLDSSFRSLHSLKGNAGYLEYGDIIELCHRAETYLDKVRDGKATITSQNITTLLQVIDALKKAIMNLFDDKPPLVAGKISLLALLDQSFSGDPDNPVNKNNLKKTKIKKIETRSVQSFKNSDGFIRVKVEKLNRLMDLVGEIVISESMVTQHPQLNQLDNQDFDKVIRNHKKNIKELQEIATSMRMIPLNRLFNKLNRVVRDLADKENKKVQLNINGGETEVDRSIIENISDPLVHILRNAIDHGIESTSERLSKGKPESGYINIYAHRVIGEIWIEIEDDGAGLDNESILKKALEQDLISGIDVDLTPQQIWGFIFTTGLSTANKVTDISGRGVGMDVVAQNLQKIHGRIDVNSVKDAGTKFTIKIPLTTAIIDSTLMRVNNSLYAIPTQDIKESVHVSKSEIVDLVNGQEVFPIREKIIPILRLDNLHRIDNDKLDNDDGIIVIAENMGQNVGIFMDEIIGLQQLVLKPLSNYADHIAGVSGCAVLGSGEICLILDISNLIKSTENLLND